jgi:hypothetical protein
MYKDGTYPDYILLKSSFLASFYTEFDLDKKPIGCKFYAAPRRRIAEVLYSGELH